ncbi:MAG TPA: hypothetical protein DD670_14550 [Planctomycetaceae bacterium]|nr:hypothetical protein [Planctomycetaceae bacterium]
MADESIENRYPRVLVVNGQPFWQGCGTGLTLMNLFKGWPKDRLACLHTSPKARPEPAFCRWQYALSPSNLRFIGRVSQNGSAGVANGTAPIVRSIDDPKADSRYDSPIRSYLRQIKAYVPRQGLKDLDAYRIPPAGLERLDEFKPQVIYTMLASNLVMKLCLDVADRYSAPIVPHFTDDWPTTQYAFSAFRFSLRRTMRRCLTEILARSPRRLVIGDAMAEEYSRRFGGDFEPFVNCVEPELLERPITAPTPREKIRLMYVGALHLDRWRSLRDIGMALMQLRDAGLEAEALVHAPVQFTGEAKRLNIPPVMRFAGVLAASEVVPALRGADVVIHVESFGRSSRIYAKYSVSTKIPQCMASARPILAYGPEELASIRYVRESGSGLAVGHRDQDELKTALRRLIGSRELREQLGAVGHRVACARHNAATERERLRSILDDAAMAARA